MKYDIKYVYSKSLMKKRQIFQEKIKIYDNNVKWNNKSKRSLYQYKEESIPFETKVKLFQYNSYDRSYGDV